MNGSSWPFNMPVDTSLYPEYRTIVKKPIDLSLIRSRLKSKKYYTTKAQFLDDIVLMCDNCRLFNGADSKYGRTATDLEDFARFTLTSI